MEGAAGSGRPGMNPCSASYWQHGCKNYSTRHRKTNSACSLLCVKGKIIEFIEVENRVAVTRCG